MVPVTIEADGIQRYPQDVEATVYFCALEALQNVGQVRGRFPGRRLPLLLRGKPAVHHH